MTRERQGWMFVGVMLPITLVNVTGLARQRVDVGAVWSVWRPMILDATLVVAGAALVAAVVAGVHAWHAARRANHA